MLSDDIWHDLNDASGVDLDIYYEPKNSGNRNGYRYNDELELDIGQDDLPCIALWKSRKNERVVICISGLNKADILKVMIKISRMAKKVYPVEAIRETVQNYIKDIFKEKQTSKTRQIEKHTPSIMIGGNAKIGGNAIITTGNVVKIDLDTSYNSVIKAINKSNLSTEDKTLLNNMLADIEQLKKKQEHKTIGEKIKGVFKWIGDKAVDVGLALTLVPYLTNLVL